MKQWDSLLLRTKQINSFTKTKVFFIVLICLGLGVIGFSTKTRKNKENSDQRESFQLNIVKGWYSASIQLQYTVQDPLKLKCK